jgi:hypothetical protein
LLEAISHGSSSASPDPVSTQALCVYPARSSNAPLCSRHARISVGEMGLRTQPRGGFFFATKTRRLVSLNGMGLSKTA